MKRFYYTTRVHRGNTVYCIHDLFDTGKIVLRGRSLPLINAAIDAMNAVQEYEIATI